MARALVDRYASASAALAAIASLARESPGVRRSLPTARRPREALAPLARPVTVKPEDDVDTQALSPGRKPGT